MEKIWNVKNKNWENIKIQKYCKNVLISSINARTGVSEPMLVGEYGIVGIHVTNGIVNVKLTLLLQKYGYTEYIIYVNVMK